ncbi:MAG: thioredoxin family protein, partial [bacterium]|nr:thioredoxin family protein [bacterium]
FSRWAQANAVLLEVDFPRRSPQTEAQKRQNRELARRHDVRGYPTIVLLDSNGKKLGQLGYEKGGPDVWLGKVRALLPQRRSG